MHRFRCPPNRFRRIPRLVPHVRDLLDNVGARQSRQSRVFGTALTSQKVAEAARHGRRLVTLSHDERRRRMTVGPPINSAEVVVKLRLIESEI